MATAPTAKTAETPTEAAADPVHPPGLRTLAFTRGFSRYNRGDVATFPLSYAEQLVKKGVAVEFHPDMRQAIQAEATQRMIRK